MKLFQVIGGDPIDLYLYVKLSVLAFSQDFTNSKLAANGICQALFSEIYKW